MIVRDDALEASKERVQALTFSMATLLATTVLRVIVVAISGSVALLADTIHSFSTMRDTGLASHHDGWGPVEFHECRHHIETHFTYSY